MRASGSWTVSRSRVARPSAIATFDRAYGRRNFDTAVALNNLAAIYQQRGERARAAAAYARALTIKKALLAPDHPSIARTAANLRTLNLEP